MNYTSFLIEALNDLIQINKDRVFGYVQAAKEMSHSDEFLKNICLKNAHQGEKNVQELICQIEKLAGSNEIKIKNKNIQLWNEFTESDNCDDVETSFASCVCSEDAVQQVYEDALLTYTFMPVQLRSIITAQKKKIGYSKREIMNYLSTHNALAVA